MNREFPYTYNYFTDDVPPNLSSKYFNTLTQEEKEKAWRDWGERCAKIVKDGNLVEEIVTKILFGKY